MALVLLLGVRPAAAAPCPVGVTPEGAQRIFRELAAERSDAACVFGGIDVDRSEVHVRLFKDGGPIDGVALVPGRCAASAPGASEELVLLSPPELAAACPGYQAALLRIAREPAGPGVITGSAPDRRFDIARIVFTAAAAVGLLIAARAIARRRPLRDLRASALHAAMFGLALAARLIVPPAPSNWYTDILPPETGSASAPLGPGAFVFHRALRAVLPLTDTALFCANAVIGALALPALVALLRQRAVAQTATVAAALMLALAPLHVRISASASEHVLSSTLTLMALLAWVKGERRRDNLLLLLSLLLVPCVALTRPDAWFQLAVLPLWALVLDRPERDATARPRSFRALAPTILYALVWGLTGVAVYFWIVVPSGQPAPSAADHLRSLTSIVTQYAIVAAAPPFWFSPAAVLLAVPGAAAMAVRRPALLGCVAATLLFAFVPLGRDFAHNEGLPGARYFLVTIPVFLVVSGVGFETCVKRLVRTAERRWTAVLHVALAAALLGPAIPAYRARYTFQDEYDFLRRALAALPDGCAVYQLPVRHPAFAHDIDCCLDAPRSSLALAFPRLRFLHADPEAPPSAAGRCAFYYETAACSIDRSAVVDPSDRPALDFYQRACAPASSRALLPPAAEADVSPRSPGGFFRSSPRVRLLRLR